MQDIAEGVGHGKTGNKGHHRADDDIMRLKMQIQPQITEEREDRRRDGNGHGGEDGGDKAFIDLGSEDDIDKCKQKSCDQGADTVQKLAAEHDGKSRTSQNVADHVHPFRIAHAFFDLN